MKRKHAFFLLLILLILVAGFSVLYGSYQLSITELFSTLAGNGTKAQEFAIFQIRLPRTLLALLVGCALGVSGGLLQGVSRNPLAEPGMIGINAGAALFVVLWISLQTTQYYSSLSLSSAFFMPFIAILGSLSSVALIYILSYRKGIQPVRFLLTGIAINTAISALITFFQLQMSKGDFNQVLTWTNGSLWGSSWQYILFILPLLVVFIGYALYRSSTLDVLAFGDELATGLEVSVQKERRIYLLLATCLAGVATAVAGNIAFLGLLGPQIARKLCGGKHRNMLINAALISSIILIFSDALARNLFSPIEIPVGIIVSIVGIPYFLYLIFTSSK